MFTKTLLLRFTPFLIRIYRFFEKTVFFPPPPLKNSPRKNSRKIILYANKLFFKKIRLLARPNRRKKKSFPRCFLSPPSFTRGGEAKRGRCCWRKAFSLPALEKLGQFPRAEGESEGRRGLKPASRWRTTHCLLDDPFLSPLSTSFRPRNLPSSSSTTIFRVGRSFGIPFPTTTTGVDVFAPLGTFHSTRA